MIQTRRIAIIAVIAFLAALAGVFIGRSLFAPPPPPGSALHAVLHDELDLDAAQRGKLAVIESHYGVQRRALERILRAENARLAEAIEAEHGNGPQVSAAVDRSHQAMGELQKVTLAHIFAMRQILRPDQTARFDRAVVKALTDDGR